MLGFVERRVVRFRRLDLGDLGPGDDRGAHRSRPVRVAVGRLGVDGHPMPHGELHPVAVEEVEVAQLGVGAADVGGQRQLATDERGRAVDGPYGELDLEQPALVDVAGRRELFVDEEEGHQPAVRGAPAPAPDQHVGLAGIGGERGDLPLGQRDARRPAGGVALPQALQGPGGGGIGVVDLGVAPPGRLDLELGVRRIDCGGKPRRGREEHDLGGAVVLAQPAAVVAVLEVVAVAAVGVDHCPPRRQHPHQVPLPYRAAVPRELLVRVRRPEQIGDDEPLELDP